MDEKNFTKLTRDTCPIMRFYGGRFDTTAHFTQIQKKTMHTSPIDFSVKNEVLSGEFGSVIEYTRPVENLLEGGTIRGQVLSRTSAPLVYSRANRVDLDFKNDFKNGIYGLFS